MKVTLHLQPGSIGITFAGMPSAITKVSETSPYGHLVSPNMVVTSVQIPGHVEIHGGDALGSTPLVELLKKHSESSQRILVLEQRPMVEIKDDDDDAAADPTFFKVHLPAGSIGVTFKSTPIGPCISNISDTSPIAEAIGLGLNFRQLEIPNVGVVAGNIAVDHLVSLLKAYSSSDERVLHLCTKPQEIHANQIMTTSTSTTTNLTNEYYVPNFGASCKIEGHEAQMATVRLLPGQTFKAQPGTMVYMSEGINFTTSIGGIGRFAAGEPLGVTTYTFQPKGSDTVAGTVALAPSFPSKIFAIDLPTYGGTIIAERGAFLFGDETVSLFGFTPQGAAGFFSGEGVRMQRIKGTGKVFLGADGVLIQRRLRAGEKLRVSTGNLAAYQFGMKMKLERVKGFANIFFSGEGLFVTTLEGPGTAWLESQPWTETAASLAHQG